MRRIRLGRRVKEQIRNERVEGDLIGVEASGVSAVIHNYLARLTTRMGYIKLLFA